MLKLLQWLIGPIGRFVVVGVVALGVLGWSFHKGDLHRQAVVEKQVIKILKSREQTDEAVAKLPDSSIRRDLRKWVHDPKPGSP